MKKSEINVQDSDGETPLYELLRVQKPEKIHEVMICLEYLLNHGADLQIKRLDQFTIVDLALEHPNRSDLLKTLLPFIEATGGETLCKDLLPLRKAIKSSSLELVQTLLSYKVVPTFADVTIAISESKNLDILRALLDVENVVEDLVDKLHDIHCPDLVKDLIRRQLISSGISCLDLPPFMALLKSRTRSATEKLEWLDYLLLKFKPNNCYFWPYRWGHHNEGGYRKLRYCTPLARVLEHFGIIVAQTENEFPDFGYQVVKKLVDHGSSLSPVATHSRQQRVEKTSHPFSSVADVLLKHGHVFDETEVGRKTLSFLCQQGATLSDQQCRKLIKSLISNKSRGSRLSSLSILTEKGVIAPELVNFGDLFQGRFHMLNVLSQESFLIYTKALGEELGTAVIGKCKYFDSVKESIRHLLLDFHNPPSLELIARHAVRKQILTVGKERSAMDQESSNVNINTLTAKIGNGEIPPHLKDSLMLKDFRAKVERIRQEERSRNET